MKKRNKTSTAKRTLASPFRNNKSSASHNRRLAFEAVERRILLSATEFEIPALQHEPVYDPVAVPLIERPVEDDGALVVPPPMKPMDGTWGDDDPMTGFPADETPVVHWEMDDEGLCSGMAGGLPVPSVPMETAPPRDGGFIDVWAIPEADGRYVESSPEEGLRFADDIVKDIHTVPPDDGRLGTNEIVIVDRPFEGGFSTQSTPPADWWIENAWVGSERGILNQVSDGGFSLESLLAGGDSFGALTGPLEYDAIVQHIVDSWHSNSEHALFFVPDAGSWFSQFRPPSEATLEQILVEMRDAAPGHEFPLTPGMFREADLDRMRAAHPAEREMPPDFEGDAVRIRVVDAPHYEADPFGPQAVFGSEGAADLAVAVPVLVADCSSGSALSRALNVLGANKDTPPAEGGFIDVGLVAVEDAGIQTGDVAGTTPIADPSETAVQGELPGLTEAIVGEAAIPLEETVARTDMPDTLLSIDPESGVLIESDLTGGDVALPMVATASEKAHDAAIEELAEETPVETAGFTHFWAPAIFAVSALGRQAWKKKHRKNVPAGHVKKNSRIILPPTIPFRMIEETDR